MGAQRFTATIESIGPGGAWTRIALPFDVPKVFGSKGRTSVRGTINGHAFRSSIFPDGDGSFHMMMNKALLSGAKASAGDRVKVVMEKDEGKRAMATPPDLARALSKSPAAGKIFKAKTDAFRNEYIVWIASAKQDETRRRRIARAVELISAGKRFSDK
jgi:Domain of unknown function (DUF1905)/Bacteriocin-protection, YdeI or OmpD-Associated